MMDKVTVRDAKLCETPLLVTMWQAIDSCAPNRPFGGDTDAKCTRAQSILEHAIKSTSAFVLVAEDGDNLSGTITGHTIERPTSQLQHIGVIYSLWVEPNARRKGIGQALLDTIEQRLTSIGAQAFQVGWDTDNQLAESWWRKRGYLAYETIASKNIVINTE